MSAIPESKPLPNSYYYQKEGFQALTKYFGGKKKGNPLGVFPTGSGKSHIIANMVKSYVEKWNARILVITHTKTIAQQNHDKAQWIWPEGKDKIGINCAGLNRRDTKSQVIFCTIQSVFKLAALIGKVNLVIVDEAHKIPPRKSAMYQKFFAELREINPNVRICGLTATPFRTESGLIYGTKRHHLFQDLVYEAHVKRLVLEGYLTPPVSEPSKNMIDTSDVPIENGEFQEEKLELKVTNPTLIKKQVDEIIQKCSDRKSWIAFCVNIRHAIKVTAELQSRGVKTALVHSKQSSTENDQIREDFEDGKYRCLVNVGMFVEGFDSPRIDALIMLNPTLSPGKYAQMVGRILRLFKGKLNALVLDFAGNVGLHGPVDAIEAEGQKQMGKSHGKIPMKRCPNPECRGFSHARRIICPYCGTRFPLKEAEDRTLPTAARDSILTEPRWFDVETMHCRDKGGILLTHYYCKGKRKFKKEVDFEAEDGQKWLKDHLGNDIPFDSTNFITAGYKTKMKVPSKIYVDEAGSASKILEYQF